MKTAEHFEVFGRSNKEEEKVSSRLVQLHSF